MIRFLDLDRFHAPIRAELDAAWRSVLDRSWYILGPELEAFEAEFAVACGVDHCVGVGSGLDALELILRAADIGPGDEVIVPGMTFVASWLAVDRVGATIVPVDVGAEDALILPAAVEAAITPRTRAIMPVHLYGFVCDMAALSAIAAHHGLLLVEDAAQAHGARRDGRSAGAFGHAAAFSFYPGKNLGAFGDGGAIVTGDAAMAVRLRRLRNYGSSVKYQHEEFGLNSRLDELQAALLRVKLRHLERWNQRRRAMAATLIRGLAEAAPEWGLPRVPAESEPAWHLFVIRTAQRDVVQRYLRQQGVETLIHYPTACHRQAVYRGRFDNVSHPLPVTECLADTVLSLPFGPHLEDLDITSLIDIIRKGSRRSFVLSEGASSPCLRT